MRNLPDPSSTTLYGICGRFSGPKDDKEIYTICFYQNSSAFIIFLRSINKPNNLLIMLTSTSSRLCPGALSSKTANFPALKWRTVSPSNLHLSAVPL